MLFSVQVRLVVANQSVGYFITAPSEDQAIDMALDKALDEANRQGVSTNVEPLSCFRIDSQ
jgi:hypothetical protein